GELVIGEYDTARRGDLHGGRLLMPVIARHLESPTAPAALTDGIAGITGELSGQKRTALLTRITSRARGLEPTRVLKAEATELQVRDRVVIVAGDGHEKGQPRQNDCAGLHVLAVARLVIQPAGGRIGEPLAAGAQQGERVHDEQACAVAGDGAREGVVPDEIVAPARLLHDNSIALDMVHNRMTMCKPGNVLDLEAWLVRQIRQKEPTRIDDLHTPFVEGEGAARRFDLCPFGQPVVHPELARIGAARNAGDPY